MKVAYNACYGGFGLSDLATDMLAKRKGVELTWYKREGAGIKGPYTKCQIDDVNVSGDGLFSKFQASKHDLGDKIDEIPNESFYYQSWYESEKRSDPDLIAIIESLGKDASGACADLQIEEIPDGAEFEISEYDGIESVVPPRKSWDDFE